MSQPVNYQILLQEAVRSALAARQAQATQDTAVMYAYYDILDIIKTQAERVGWGERANPNSRFPMPHG